MEENRFIGLSSSVDVEEIGYTAGVCVSLAALVYGVVKLFSTKE